MGSKYFETPHLDEPADEGLVFNQAYMYPTCSPSRAEILTGKQSFRTGCYNVPVLEKGNDQDNIFSRWTVGAEHLCYASVLEKAGYHAIHISKWHIVGPWPDKESQFPLDNKLKQPDNGDLSWLAKHQSSALQKFYPTGRGFETNVGRIINFLDQSGLRENTVVIFTSDNGFSGLPSLVLLLLVVAGVSADQPDRRYVLQYDWPAKDDLGNAKW